MRKLKLLDTFCYAGGCAYGYAQAGFKVTGVDLNPQPNIAPGVKFIKGDAFDYIEKNAHKYDIISASPHCQRYSVSTSNMRKQGKEYPDQIPALRELLKATGKPYIIENVFTAPLRKDLILDGRMFGLRVIRKRIFEVSDCLQDVFLLKPAVFLTNHTAKNGNFATVCGKGSLKTKNGNAPANFAVGGVLNTWQVATGNTWMLTNDELAKSIPWAYTKYIGDIVYPHLEKRFIK